MSKNVMIKSVTIFTLVLLWVSFSFAATTGKISGVVKDATSGEALPGANVIIDGSTMGGSTDLDGNYFILNVPPGTYNLRATFIGYTAQVIEEIVVRVDRTTSVDFGINQETIAGQEVTITAEREVVRMDVSYSQTSLSAESMEAIPATYRLDDVLESQAGIEQGKYGLEIRGSNYKEIGYFVDGVSMRNERMDQGVSQLSTTAIQEVQVLTGGFSAEYGNARAGIVNVVNKTPGKKYFVNVEGRMSPLWGGDDPNYPGLKHFGPNIFSNDNWYEYGRYDWNGGAPSADRNGDGAPDFQGWNSWASNNQFRGNDLTAEQAFKVWQWQHRSEDENGNILYNGETIGTIDQMYASPASHNDPFNWYGYRSDYVGDISFGGPVPMTGGKVGFLVSHIRENSMYPTASPTGGVYAYNTTQAKFTYSLNNNMKLTLNSMYQDMKSLNSGDPEPRDGVDGIRQVGVTTVASGNDETYRKDTNINPKGIYTNINNITWTHTLSPATFYEVKLTQSNMNYHQIGNNRARNFGNVYQIGPVWMDEGPKGWSYQQGDDRDILGLYRLRGDRNTDLSQTHTMAVNFDITSQVTTNHQLKAGFEYLYKDVLEKTGFTQNYLFLINEAYRNGPDGQWGTPDDGSPGDQANWHDVRVTPWYGAAYVQDRMEYGGMILNLGLRMDLHKPHNDWYDRNDLFFSNGPEYWDVHLRRFGSNVDNVWGDSRSVAAYGSENYVNYYGLEADTHPPLRAALSPRLGISHPIGPESKVFFNYGHFYDTITNDHLYRQQIGVDEPVEEIGNPWMWMPKTIQFEAGYEQRLFNDYLVNVSGYYKDVTDDIAGTSLRTRGGGTSYSYNGIGRDIKGVEINLEKRYGTFFTGFVNTDYSTQKVSNYGFDRLYHPEDQVYIDDPQLTEWLEVVRNPFINSQTPGRWTAKLNLAMHSPQDWGPGPVMGGAKLLGWWDVSLYHRYEQGPSFTWNPDGLQRLQGVYNKREKAFNRTDLHIEKRFTFAGINAGAFMDVTNLFNVKNLSAINNARDWGRLVSRADRGNRNAMQRAYMKALEDEGKSYGEEVNDESLMPQRLYYFYDIPRDFWLGVRLYF